MGLFVTPENERSFGGLVDDVVTATGKPSIVRSICGFINGTIRECQQLGTFDLDTTEVEVTVTADPMIWVRPAYFRSIRAVQYATQVVYPDYVAAGKSQLNRNYYYYAVDDSFVFKGALVGEIINLHVLKWVTPKRYFSRLGENTSLVTGGPYTTRPAYFDLDTGLWSYLASGAYTTTLGSDALDLAARNLSWHWMMESFYDMVLEGAKTKAFAGGGDQRNIPSYALYKTLQNSFKQSMGISAEGRTGGDGR